VRKKVFASILFMFLFASLSAPQSRPGPPPPGMGAPTIPDIDETRERIARDIAKQANQERHAALKSDTDKLVKLVEELKQDVDKSNENVLSLDVLKKADEIEKLAHSVKEKMKGPN
jgi:hypothetical protein